MSQQKQQNANFIPLIIFIMVVVGLVAYVIIKKQQDRQAWDNLSMLAR